MFVKEWTEGLKQQKGYKERVSNGLNTKHEEPKSMERGGTLIVEN